MSDPKQPAPPMYRKRTWKKDFPQTTVEAPAPTPVPEPEAPAPVKVPVKVEVPTKK